MPKPVRDDLPPCPREGHQGEGWVVLKYGVSNPKSKRPKQRYMCKNPEGERLHSFVPVLPRDRVEQDKTCRECGQAIGVHQGPATLPGSRYQIVEVVHALLDVAGGMTYTEATRRLRRKYLKDRSSYQTTGEDSGSTVANWVDLYAPILLGSLLPTAWPAGVGFDSTEFMYTNTATGTRYQLFTVLAAVGYEKDKRGQIWSIKAAPNDNEAAWTDLLNSKTGKPKWVVYDGDLAIGAAVSKTWSVPPKPTTLYWSEHHLFKNALAAVKKDGRGDYNTEFPQLLTLAFQTLTGWEVFVKRAQEENLTDTLRWIAVRDKGVRAQLVLRNEVGKYTTGGVEPMLNTIKDDLSRRSWTFRNLNRMNLLLGLTQLRLNRLDNPYDWVEVLTEALYNTKGKSTNSYNRDGTDLFGARTSSLRTH